MPRGVGIFIRTNGEFDGERVWQDDLATNIKIIALRHDTHDQDIADGVAECLPKSGGEPMLGSLNMGGFKILDQADGASATDGASRGQTVNSMSFDEPTRQLTLLRTGSAMAPLTVTIPSDGDNTTITTGVQEITIGSGLNLDSAGGGNVLNEGNNTGEISLSTINGVAGDYVNPNLTVDSKGRITAATTGNTGGGTDLGKVQGVADVKITSSTGADTIIGDATAARAGVMSIAQHDQLDQASADITVNQASITTLQGDTVKLTGDQSIGGTKTFASQTFFADGSTTDGNVRMLNLPASLPAAPLVGDLYVDNGFIKIKLS